LPSKGSAISKTGRSVDSGTFDTISAGNIRIPKTGELVAARLRKAIVKGDLKPGDKLPSEAIMITNFEVSRPTLREALRILEFEGLISVSRGVNGGTKVTALSGDMLARAAGLTLQLKGATIAEIYEARTAIEPSAARIAAETGGNDVVAALRAQLKIELAVTDDYDAMAKGIADFHSILMERCGNVALGMVGQALHDVVERHMMLSHRNRPPTDAKKRKLGLVSQKRVIDLIEAKDPHEAEAHWRRHMIAAGEHWMKDMGGTSVVDVFA
jgi:DNA-binding FadR family transcriptional regulator